MKSDRFGVAMSHDVRNRTENAGVNKVNIAIICAGVGELSVAFLHLWVIFCAQRYTHGEVKQHKETHGDIWLLLL